MNDQNRYHHEVSSELEQWHEKNRRILDELAKVTDGMRADDREHKLRTATDGLCKSTGKGN